MFISHKPMSLNLSADSETCDLISELKKSGISREMPIIDVLLSSKLMHKNINMRRNFIV